MQRVHVDEPRQFVFLAYNPEELNEFYDPPFRFGDLLVEDGSFERLSPDEIIVRRLEDGHTDSVWIEEVLQLNDARGSGVTEPASRAAARSSFDSTDPHRARAPARALRGGVHGAQGDPATRHLGERHETRDAAPPVDAAHRGAHGFPLDSEMRGDPFVPWPPPA